jgi:hypothetical protein
VHVRVNIVFRFQNRRMKWKKERKEERNRTAEISHVSLCTKYVEFFLQIFLSTNQWVTAESGKP